MRYPTCGIIMTPSLGRAHIMRIAGVLVLAFVAGPAIATNYYVSTTGSNSNSGTSLASPFLTIQQAANRAQAGDNVYVEGGTYRETVTVANSGTAAAPITFQPYNNQQVTITGLDQLGSGWTDYSGPIYSNTVGSAVSQVFVNGAPMNLARWPNPVYNNPLRAVSATVDSASIQPSPQNSTITDAALGSPSNGYWNGAKMAIVGGAQTGRWVAYSTTIASQTGNTLAFQPTWPNNSSYNPAAGNRYYLYNSLNAMSSSKQWYYDASAGKVYLEATGYCEPQRPKRRDPHACRWFLV